MFLEFWQYCFCFVLFSCNLFLCDMATPRVYIDNDDFKGFIVGVEKYESNTSYSAFMGIPYAKPPLGELRFKDPQKLDRFEGTIEATHDGFECCSITAKNGSENCLNLNVYTKFFNPLKPLPVVVLIHPGGWYLGSGASHFMNPAYMMTKDIVVVTFNHRLGSLGFLNLGTADVPGNAGHKDQVYALRWVKKFIKHFGGNSEDITLMGYSAGGISVCLHLVSPMSKGLFHKAIIMSGAMPPQIVMPQGQQKYLAIRQAKRLDDETFKFKEEEIPYGVDKIFSDYKDIEAADILQSLNKFSGQEIANSLRKLFDFGKDNPILLWLPVKEEDFQQERFLTEDFYTSLEKIKDWKIPLLIGYTNGELNDSSKEILENKELKEKLSKDFEKLAPRNFMYERYKNRDHITKQLRQKYFKDSQEFSAKDHDALSDLYSDSLLRFGSHKVAEVVHKNGGLVYFYEFTFVADPFYKDEQFPDKKARCEHMNDLQYLFNWTGKTHTSEKELKMIEMFNNFIYDFVKRGKLSDEKAKPYPEKYARINENIEYVEGRNFKNYEFYSQIFQKDN